MATDLERMVVSLEASITKYERTMARAVGVANTRGKQIESRFAGIEAKIKNFGVGAFEGFARGAIGALAPILSVAAAVQGVKAALREFGDIADNSAAAGVDPEFFQGIAYQAKLAGVEISGVAGALAMFAKNSGLAAEGKGKMVGALQALNPELLKSIQLASTQEQRFLLVADAIAKSSSASEAAAISAAAFGDQGAKLVAVLKGGADQITRMNANAREMGLIVERELIEKADEFGDKFDTAARIIDLKLKRAFISLAPVLVSTAGLAADFARLMGIAADQLNAIENRQYLRPLQNELAGVYNQMQPVKEEIASFQRLLAGEGGKHWQLELNISDAQAKLAGLTAQAEQLLSRITELQGYKPPVAPGSTEAPADPLAGMLGRGGPGKIKLAEPFYTPGGDKGAVSSRNDAAAAALRQAEAVQTLIADLQFEQSIMGQSALEQEILTQLRHAGVEAMSAEGQAIRQLITDIDAQSEANERLEESLELVRSIASDAVSGFISDLREGKSAAEALSNVFDRMAEKLIDIAVQNLIGAAFGGLTGGGGGILGGLLGFASGTANTGGARGQVRGIVHGQEAVIPLPSGGRVPVELRMPNLAGSGAGGSAAATRIVLEVQEGAAFTTRILEVAGPQSAEITRNGLKGYDRALPGRSAEQDARFR